MSDTNVTKMSESKFKIGKEAAREQLDLLYNYYEIDLDELPGDLGKALKATDLKLLKSIRLGRVETSTDEAGVIKVVQTLRNGEALEYREIDGAAKVAMGSKDEKDHYGKAYALMGALCGLGETAITKLKSHDLSVVECLGTVFLQA